MLVGGIMGVLSALAANSEDEHNIVVRSRRRLGYGDFVGRGRQGRRADHCIPGLSGVVDVAGTDSTDGAVRDA